MEYGTLFASNEYEGEPIVDPGKWEIEFDAKRILGMACSSI
jgi:hypothetical protein